MHCDYWIGLLILTLLSALVPIASGRAYTIEELNSVILVLDVPLSEYQNNDVIRNTLYELIANFSTTNCTSSRQTCKLIAKYYRNTGPYKRNITDNDYIFSGSDVAELQEAKVWEDTSNSSMTGTTIVFNLRTKTGHDYLKWTELVRLLYYHTSSLNVKFQETANMTDVNIIREVPESYIAKVIKDNTATPTIIACVILGSAIILFIILIPLSNTKYCRKELDDSIEEVTADSS